jgi:hypothetical protein
MTIPIVTGICENECAPSCKSCNSATPAVCLSCSGNRTGSNCICPNSTFDPIVYPTCSSKFI